MESAPAARFTAPVLVRKSGAFEVHRALEDPAAARIGAQRCLHVRKRGHIRIAQDEADIRMRNETPRRTDDIGPALAPNPDAVNDVPDQRQVDEGDGHAGVLPRAGNRQRGDLLAELSVTLPTNLSDEERRLLQRLRELRNPAQ